MNFASPAPTFRLSRAFLRLRPPPRPTAQMVRSGQKRMRAGDRIVRDDAWWRGEGGEERVRSARTLSRCGSLTSVTWGSAAVLRLSRCRPKFVCFTGEPNGET